ncbi:DsbA family protein [Homoserinimonas sp. OAct 916]|uniref:DsbA family oxidoreductase n=1 Tax=Homoserinimonas sp. OAct 916 TaxID=2211450 RepID=UPI000DBE6D81|nr:DsbA family oxidoreductase [Homoserinimonas sp. OAct 916]
MNSALKDTGVKATAIKVDIWSDIACPWCYIGKRRFEAGVASFDGDVDVEYHSYELTPDAPVDFVGTVTDYLAEKKGMSTEQVTAMFQAVIEIAAGEGLHYDYESVTHTNTVKAHQVLHLAKAHGVQTELQERLFQAYFEQGAHVGHDDVLADLAADVGLDRAEVLRSLAENEYLAAVRADQARAREYGIQTVPFFVLDGKYGISGAQEAATFTQALNQVVADRETATA